MNSWEVRLPLLLLLLPSPHLASTRLWKLKSTDPSLTSSPNTLLLLSMLLRMSGRNARELRPRPLDSLSSRLLPALLNLITNIVVSMLVTGILTRTLLPSLTLSSKNTTEYLPALSTPLTWMLARSRVTLLKMSQFTLAESVLVVPSMDSVFPPESPRNSVLELKNSWFLLLRTSLLILLDNTILSLACKKIFANNWLMTTSCLSQETET